MTSGLKDILRLHRRWLSGELGGVKANLRGFNLRGFNLRDANLRDADLEGADLRDADLRGAHLRDANLKYADLRCADLRDADLRDANLKYADLRCADLKGANLEGADLKCASLDFSCWPLSRRSLKVGRTDDELVSQLLYHTLRAAEKSTGPLSKKLLGLKTVVDIANRFHRVSECGYIDRRTTKV